MRLSTAFLLTGVLGLTAGCAQRQVIMEVDTDPETCFKYTSLSEYKVSRSDQNGDGKKDRILKKQETRKTNLIDPTCTPISEIERELYVYTTLAREGNARAASALSWAIANQSGLIAEMVQGSLEDLNMTENDLYRIANSTLECVQYKDQSGEVFQECGINASWDITPK